MFGEARLRRWLRAVPRAKLEVRLCDSSTADRKVARTAAIGSERHWSLGRWNGPSGPFSGTGQASPESDPHGDRGYDADWFPEAPQDKGIRADIYRHETRKTPVKYDKRRNRIEIMFGRLNDWRRVATRYDKCPKVLLSAVALTATALFLAMRPEPRIPPTNRKSRFALR